MLRQFALVSLGLAVFLYLLASPTHAACNLFQGMTASNKNVSFASTCSVDMNTIDGIDYAATETSTTNSATLTLNEGGSITFSANSKLIVGSIVLGGGNIALYANDNTSEIQLGTPLYVPDGDGDGWPSSFTFTTATASGLRRLSLMREYSGSSTDCNDSSDPRIDNVCCTSATRYRDQDGDGYGNASSTIFACPTAGYVDNSSDCNDTGSNSGNVYISATCYLDNDNDNYGGPTVKTCMNNATCGSATWASGGAGTAAASGNFASNTSDCGDGDANAKPSSTYCSSGTFVHRASGNSYDWNCSGGTGSNNSATWSKCGNNYSYSGATYTAYNNVCYSKNNNDCTGRPGTGAYSVVTIGCGSAGYLCGGTFGVRTCSGEGASCSEWIYAYVCTVLGTYGTQQCQ